MYQKSHISHGIEIQKFQETFHLKFEILIKEKRKNEEEIMKKKKQKEFQRWRKKYSLDFEIYLLSERMHAIISLHGWNM